MLTGVCDTVGVGVARVTVFLRVVVFGDRADLASLRIAVAGGRGAGAAERPTVAAFGLRGSALLRVGSRLWSLAARRRSRFFLWCTGPRVARVANTSKRTLPASTMRPVVVRSGCLFPQIVELDEFRL